MSRKYILVIDGIEKVIRSRNSGAARKRAREWGRDTAWDYGEAPCTTAWVDVHILDARRNDVDTITVAIDPPAPKCVDGSRNHEWTDDVDVVGGIKESPGVCGHGGGVTVTTACNRCGCGRTVDTWAQRPDTGEQGLMSLSYDPEQFIKVRGNSA